MKQAVLICDMQFGSTGKGLIAGYLAEVNNPDTVVTAWAANAGHTYIDSDGRKYVHTMLANGIVSNSLERVMLGGGSLLNLDNLREEVKSCADILTSNPRFEGILIHESAAVIQERHRVWEAENMLHIGSTAKGVGRALTEKIARSHDMSITAKHILGDEPHNWSGVTVRVVKHSEWVRILHHEARNIQIEGAQGYSLGINSGFYPHCTSRECTPRQILVDCGIPSAINPAIVGCVRTFPIRVANRKDDNGKQIGYSGDCYDDQVELSWEDIGVEAELTTVTKLPRRIFSWSDNQFIEAMTMVAPDAVFMNFANYCKNKHTFSDCITKVAPRYIGFGATVDDVYDVGGMPKSKIVQLYIDKVENSNGN